MMRSLLPSFCLVIDINRQLKDMKDLSGITVASERFSNRGPRFKLQRPCPLKTLSEDRACSGAEVSGNSPRGSAGAGDGNPDKAQRS